MATKINTDYYGAENTWVDISGTDGNIKTENYSINDHITANDSTKWDIENGAIPDTTASPWGIGRSSLSSYGYAVLTCVNRGTEENYGGNLRKKVYEVNKGNMPITFVNKSGMIYAPATDYARNWVLDNKRRFVGKTRPKTGSNSTVLSTNAVDNGEDIYMGDRQSSGKTITYADYQQLRYRLGAVGLVKISGNNIDYWSSGIKDLPNLISQFPNEDYIVFGANNWIGLKGSSSASYIRATFGVKTPVPEWLHQLYFDDNITEWLPFNRAIDNYIGSPSYSALIDCGSKSAYRVEDLESGTKYADFAQQSLTNGGLPATWVCASNYKQVFNDVSYHWELVYFVNVSEWNEVHENQRIPATMGSDYSGRYFMKLAIDDSIYDNYYTACYYALLHEAAFLGLPFSDSYYGEESIGDTHVFLPVFDEHMITTGEYKSGADSLELPNATWGDIFGADMPDYDPTYDPDPQPEPEEKDSGDTKNLGRGLHFFPDSYHIYLLSGSEFYQAMVELNSYYSDKTPDDWSVDFQGVNPSDYIIGAYVTQLSLPPSSTGSSIKIGNIELNTSAYELSKLQTYWETFSYGTRYIEPLYHDFRDYEPYTKLELYLPLAGTVELDVAYCMGHDITVNYYYDIMTMSAVAAVYRDDMLYKTLDFAIGSQVPLLSSNMGSYQNQIEQLSVARQRNNIALATSATAAIAGATVGVATGSPMAILGSFGGFSKYANELMTSKELDYQFDHIAPTVSQTGAAESQNSLCVGQLTPKLIIKRAVSLPHDDSIYSKTVGNACCINTTVGSMSGRIVCSNIDCNNIINDSGMSPTADEINAIKQAFASGVII